MRVKRIIQIYEFEDGYDVVASTLAPESKDEDRRLSSVSAEDAVAFVQKHLGVTA